jgi:AbiU2
MAAKKAPRRLNESEFQRVFKEVRADINELQLHNKVFGGVVENLGKHPRLGINFPAFFGAFLAAMRTDMVIRLGRIYDPEGTGHDSCTLTRCLSTLRDNSQFFTGAAITARLTEAYREANADFLSWHRADLKKIDADLTTIERSRTRLIKLRHKLYAHKDLETVLSGKRDDFLSSHEEVTELIRLAHDIWNRHSQVWNASTYSAKTIGEDDYKWLFNCLRRGMRVKTVIDNRRTERLLARIKVRKEGKS